jgi:leucyl aminopeptidase
VLADCLTAAGKPDLLIDFATLTGAARVALGTELPALFVNDETFAAELLEASARTGDAIYRLPLHRQYRSALRSDVADLNNANEGGYGGAITAALFLEEFVGSGVPWAHFDVMAYNLSSRPGHPRGGEAMGMRAVFEAVATRLRAAR